MAQPDNYTVGWICAVKPEYVAAQAFLDEIHETPLYVAPHDNNNYKLGRMGRHNVVIACLPKGEYGLVAAGNVARDMVHSFPNVRIGLMVGLGGGAPTERHDIRLGDVVISSPQDGTSGVFHYDYGKAIENHEFLVTGFLNQPPSLLRGAVTGLEAEYELNGNQLQTRIDDVLRRKPTLMRAYRRPDASTDILHKTGIVHPANEDKCTQTCNIPENLVDRVERFEDENLPAIHLGLIASANKLMKDSKVRDRLAEENNVLCFEMEAAGLMNHFPCIVIRGICDYADSHKNKHWQGYASMVAAAYAKELLGQIIPSRIETEGKIGDLLTDISKGVEEMRHKQRDESHETILNWLTPVEYGPDQNDYFKRGQAGTGQWMIESTEFQGWMDSPKSTLFCPGMPGAGKTILTSIVVDNLINQFRNDTDVAVAYIYCNFHRRHEQSLEDLVASLLRQLGQQLPDLPREIDKLYKDYKKTRIKPSLDDVLEALRSVITAFTRVFVVVDAFDECQTTDGCRTRLLSELLSLQSKNGINLLITSRDVLEISEKLSGGHGVRLEIRATDKDVGRFLDGNMDRLPQVSGRLDVQDEIKAAITKAVDGMFLLAKLHFDSLIGARSVTVIREILKTLPTGSTAYFESYHKIMERIEQQGFNQRELAKEVLSWIIHARRSLRTDELQHAIATIPYVSTRLTTDDLSTVEYMASSCGGLVIVDETSNTIRLVHYTAQEYFSQTQNDWFPTAEGRIAAVCLTYLSFETFDSGPCHTDEEFAQRETTHHLYDYAAKNWGYHARKASSERIIRERCLDFLHKESHLLASIQVLFLDERHDGGFSQRIPHNVTELHIAAYFGLHEVTTILLGDGFPPASKDSNGRTPLSFAAENGHEDVVRLYLDMPGIDSDGMFHWDRTPFSYAAGGGHVAVIELFLDTNRAECDKPDRYERTPLSYAAENGHAAVVALLLRTGQVSLDSNDNFGCTPLLYATKNGHKEVTTLLLGTAGVDVHWKDKLGYTPLSFVAQKGDLSMFKLLWEQGRPHPHSHDSYRRSVSKALQEAAEEGHLPIIVWILDNQWLEPAIPAEALGRVLGIAARHGHTDVVNMLIGLLALDTSVPNSAYDGAFCQAIEHGHIAIARKLVEVGQLITYWSSAEGKKTDPLGHAALSGRFTAVEWLLNDCKVKIKVYSRRRGGDQSALSYAAEKGCLDICSLLLIEGRLDPTRLEGFRRTPLSYAVRERRYQVVELFIDHAYPVDGKLPTETSAAMSSQVELGHESDSDSDAKEEEESGAEIPYDVLQAFLQGAEHGQKSLVALFLSRDIPLRPNDLGEALQNAAANGHSDIVRLLIATGKADPEFRDAHRPLHRRYATLVNYREGRPPVSLAAEKGHADVVNILLETGRVDAEAADIRGRRPLSYAALNGHLQVVEILLDKGGVDPGREDAGPFNQGHTPLLYAARQGHDSVVRRLLATGRISPETGATLTCHVMRTPFSFAAGNGHLSIVKQLLKTGGINPDAQASDWHNSMQLVESSEPTVDPGEGRLRRSTTWTYIIGRTPLSFAAENGYSDVVALLTTLPDVDVNSKDREGQTPLMWAAGNGHKSVVKLLLDIDSLIIDDRDKFGQTALLFAAREGHRTVIRSLLDTKKVDVDAMDNMDRTPLFHAAARGHQVAVMLLLKEGSARSDVEDQLGETPLSYACRRGYEAVVSLLLKFGDALGRDKVAQAHRGASKSGHKAVVKLLHDAYGVDFFSADDVYSDSELEVNTKSKPEPKLMWPRPRHRLGEMSIEASNEASSGSSNDEWLFDD